MAELRWFLVLFNIGNADYLRRLNDNYLSGVIRYTYYEWFFITTYLTLISEQRENNEHFLFR